MSTGPQMNNTLDRVILEDVKTVTSTFNGTNPSFEINSVYFNYLS